MQAGVPEDAINVVFGNQQEIGSVLTTDTRIRKVTFTGSTSVGKQLHYQVSDTLKRLSLELGGSAPIIVFDDADVDLAVRNTISSKFRNAGQTCICGNRLLVQRGVYQKFMDKLEERTRKIRLGHGLLETTTMGPLIDSNGFQKSQLHVEDAVGKGATLVVGGGEASVSNNDGLGGNFFSPTILTDTNTDMMIWKEETFGPVMPVMIFHDEDEAVHLANDTEYGLAAYYFTSSLGRSWRVGERLEFGLVGLNDVTVSLDSLPFGGWSFIYRICFRN